MKASDYIASFFESKGIDVIFGYIGGMITHIVDSIDKNPRLTFVQTYHEQTAAIAAEGYALEKGVPGVAVATSGPGATNLLTGIADAFFGSIPTIYITGQVNSYEYKYSKPIRQQGFQETDVVAIVKPVTKYATFVDKAENLCYELEKAFYIATSGRKGPVLLDITMDVTRAEIDPKSCRHFSPDNSLSTLEIPDSVIKAIQNAERPMLLVGGGCQGSNQILDTLLVKTNIPVVSSLMGRGAIDETYPLYMGMVGSYGNRCANMAISQCDLLIALGSRLDTRQTGANIRSFIPDAIIIHVDIDQNELDHHRLPNRIACNCDTARFAQWLIELDPKITATNPWIDWLRSIKQEYSQIKEIERFVENKSPYRFILNFNAISKPDAVITADIGQNQMWVAQTISLKKGQRFVTSGGLAPMGFSLPAAIGIAFANRNKTIYCFNGDGGLHMACQSLLLISQYKLNIKVIILNNSALGMITQFQHLYFNDRMTATTAQGGYLTPNFESMADAYGIPYLSVTPESVSETILAKTFESRNVILDYKISGRTSVSPKLEYNQPIYNPSPHLEKYEMKKSIPF